MVVEAKIDDVVDGTWSIWHAEDWPRGEYLVWVQMIPIRLGLGHGRVGAVPL